MIDLLYLAKGRLEFTRASANALLRNTIWGHISSVHAYCDGWANGSRGWAGFVFNAPAVPTHFYPENIGGPVAIMAHYLTRPSEARYVAKIDNDVIVPPGWLDACLAVMEENPEVDLLGIEPPQSRTPAPWAKGTRVDKPEVEGRVAIKSSSDPRGYAPCKAVGGIGLFRRSAFENRPLPKPHGWGGVGGFTDWQLAHPEVTKGWLVPPIKVFLLDRLPVEPWASLSKQYIERGEQRPWTNYDPKDVDLWEWWTKEQK